MLAVWGDDLLNCGDRGKQRFSGSRLTVTGNKRNRVVHQRV